MVSDNTPSAVGTSSTSAPRLWPRIAPSLWVLACAPIAAAVLASAIIGSDLASREFLRSYRPPNIYEVNLALVTEFAEKLPGASDVVLLGDSSAECSLDPVQWERRSGLRCADMTCVGVVGIDGFGVLLRRYMERHPCPRAVVLAIHPWALGVPDYEVGPMHVRQRFLRCYGDAGVFSVLKATIETLATPGKRVENCQDFIRSAVDEAVGRSLGMTPEEHFDTIVPTIHGDHALTYNRVKSVLWERRGFVQHFGAMNPDDRWPYAAEFPVREEHKEAMRNLIALANQYSILLIVRLTPVLTMPRDARFEEMHGWLAQLERENPNVVVSRPELIEYPPEYHMERLHLNTAGAEKFTAFVAEDVRRILVARRPNGSESAERNGF